MIYALHGMLSTSEQWDFIEKAGCQTFFPELFSSKNSEQNILPYDKWAKDFTLKVQNDGAKKRILCGYSLGGRLGLHALSQKPQLWDGAIFLSTHPGLLTCEEKKQRKEHDLIWSEKCIYLPWPELLKEWNSQPIFNNENNELVLQEKDFCRHKLAAAMRYWSLAEQENFRDKIEKLSIPILWITGSLDKKFCQLAASVRLSCKNSAHIAIEGASHRLLNKKYQDNLLKILIPFFEEIL